MALTSNSVDLLDVLDVYTDVNTTSWALEETGSHPRTIGTYPNAGWELKLHAYTVRVDKPWMSYCASPPTLQRAWGPLASSPACSAHPGVGRFAGFQVSSFPQSGPD